MGKRICKVLVVEDDDFVRDLLEQVLEEDGYRFTAVANGKEMVAELAGPEIYDVAVIDYHLPGGADGVSLANLAERHGLAVIMVSGSGDERALDAMTAAGYRLLSKPFRVAELLAAVEEGLSLAKRDCERGPNAVEACP